MSFICQEIIVSWRDQCSRAPIFCLFLTLFALSGPLSPYHNSGEEGRLCRTSPALSVRTRKTKMSWETNTRRPAAFHAPGASTGPAAQIRGAQCGGGEDPPLRSWAAELSRTYSPWTLCSPRQRSVGKGDTSPDITRLVAASVSCVVRQVIFSVSPRMFLQRGVFQLPDSDASELRGVESPSQDSKVKAFFFFFFVSKSESPCKEI